MVSQPCNFFLKIKLDSAHVTKFTKKKHFYKIVLLDEPLKEIHKLEQSLLDVSIGYLLNRTALNLNNLFARRLKDYNITPEQFVLITRLVEEEGITLKYC